MKTETPNTRAIAVKRPAGAVLQSKVHRHEAAHKSKISGVWEQGINGYGMLR